MTACPAEQTLLKHESVHDAMPTPTPCKCHRSQTSAQSSAYRAEALLAAGQLALAGGLVLSTAGLKLVSNGLLTDLLGLLLVDGLHEHTLVLVHVTLHLRICARMSETAER